MQQKARKNVVAVSDQHISHIYIFLLLSHISIAAAYFYRNMINSNIKTHKLSHIFNIFLDPNQ